MLSRVSTGLWDWEGGSAFRHGPRRTIKIRVNPVIDEIAVNPERTIEDNTHRWFALRVKCRYEKLVSTLLRDKGYEEFLPLYWSRRRWSDRFQSVDLPLFPGYVFCRLDPQQSRLPLLITPGAMHFVGIGRSPEPIDDGE